MEKILKRDVALYVDVHCYGCKKAMAPSNAIQADGRYFCQNCTPAYQLICVGCGKPPNELPEYVEAAEQDGFASADDYVKAEEGTLNVRNGHFLCTHCYVNAGCPSSPIGWIAP